MKKAQSISPDTFSHTLSAREYHKLLDHALNSSRWYASRWQRSSQQVRDRLVRQGYVLRPVQYRTADNSVHTEDIVERTIQQLQDEHLIDDTAMIESVVRESISSGRGLRWVHDKLRRAGIDDSSYIHTSLELSENDVHCALDTAGKQALRAERVHTDAPVWKRRQRITARLLRRGFDSADIATWIHAHSTAIERISAPDGGRDD